MILRSETLEHKRQGMADPVVISIPHRLGRAEARRRLEAGIAQVVAPLGRLVSIDRRVWTGDRLDFGMSVAGQTARGLVDVEDLKSELSLNSPGFWRPSQSASVASWINAGGVFCTHAPTFPAFRRGYDRLCIGLCVCSEYRH